MNVEVVRNWAPPPVTERYGVERTILYALAVGAGREPEELDFVYERRLRAIPSLAVLLASEGFWLQDPRTGVDWTRIVHGGQTLTMHRPLPATGTLVGRMTVAALVDRGPERGAAIHYTRTLEDARDGELVAEVGLTVLMLGDGGFGASSGTLPIPHAIPGGPPDAVTTQRIRPDQAALYRLTGDMNPLHIDPEFARGVGFERPILHGLCTYGFAARAALRLFCDDAPERLRQLDVRFTAPVFAGDTLRHEFWHEGPGRAAFRTRVVERDAIVLGSGLVRWS